MTCHRRTTYRGVASVSGLLLALAGCSDEVSGGIDPISKVHCVALTSGMVFEYEVVDFSDGSVLADCSVSDVYTESSDSSWWAPDQSGAERADCAVTMDTSGTATAGWWLFQLDATGDATVTYNDTGDANDGSVLVFEPADCVYLDL